MEYERAKLSNKLLAAIDLDSDTWAGEVKRIRGKKQPLTATGVHALRNEYTRTIEPARALAAETLNLERTLSDFVNLVHAVMATTLRSVAVWQDPPPRPLPHGLPGFSRVGREGDFGGRTGNRK